MNLYTYDNNGVFTGITQARACPVTERKRKKDLKIEQVFLIPADATTKEVPEYDASKQYAQFIDDEWVVKDIPEQEEDVVEQDKTPMIMISEEDLNLLLDEKVEKRVADLLPQLVETLKSIKAEEVVDDVISE